MFTMEQKTNSSLPTLEDLSLHYALYMLRTQLFLLIVCLCAFSLIYFHHIDFFWSNRFYLWMTATGIFLLTGLAINYLLIFEHHIRNHLKSLFIYISVFIAGIFCALGYYTLNLAFGPFLNADNFSLIISIFLCLIIVHISATLFLTSNYKYFLTFIIPAFFPTIQIDNQLFSSYQHNLLYQLCVYIYLAFILISGFFISRSHKKFIKNTLYIKSIEDSNLSTHALNSNLEQQLQQKTDLCETIKAEMELNKNIMEEKVKERIIDIKTINARLERSHQNLEMAHEMAGIASWDWDIQNRCIETGNFIRLFGYNIQSVNYYIQYLHKFIHPDDIENVKLHMRSHLRGFLDRYEVVYRMFHQTEGWVWVHDLGRVIQRDPKSNIPLRMVGIRRNINNEKKAEEILTLSANVFKKMAQGIFVLDNQLRYIDANPYFLTLVGFTEQELIGRYIFEISANYTPQLQQFHAAILQQLLSKGEFDGEVIETLKTGKETPLWMHVNSIRDTQHKVTQYIGLVTDLTERKAAEEKLFYLRTYDALTDLPNRSYFNNKLHTYLNDSTNNKSKFAVIRINLDRFRYYNELLNQQGGDELLKEVATRLRRVSSDAAVIARLNADDFAAILEIEDSNIEVTEFCKSLIQAFDDTFRIKQQEFVMTISIGVAIFPEHGRQMDSLNTHAEIALLEAKRIGGNVIRIYHHDKHLVSEPRLKLESELRKAIQNNELLLYFQPKFHSKTQAIYGFEALIRWNHPEHGIIPPAQFIPLAEETSLISEIGKQVLEMACTQIKKWENAGFTKLIVSINVVVQQIYRGNLLDEIDFMIKKYDINPAQLEVEITETSLMENNENVRKVIDELHRRKIKIALDDFGIGYSALSYLANYSFDIIKIDRSFVNGIGNPNKEAIIRAIIAMSKAMNKQVVAEGIETQAHYQFLIKEGCDYLQGYLLGKPMPTDMATALLQENQREHFANLSIPE